MSARWPHAPGTEPDPRLGQESPEPGSELGAAESWRSWLVSGSRVGGVDPRRVRGEHRGLKKMLIEGVATGGRQPESWRHFSGAMVRLAINDALNSLPSDQTRIVWLAYFAGKSNREIAKQLGLSVGAVQRRLRLALAQVADQIERGRKSAYGLILYFTGNRFWHHPATSPWGAAVRAAGIVAAGVAAATTIAVQAPSLTPQAPAAPAVRPAQAHPAAGSEGAASRGHSPTSLPGGVVSPADLLAPAKAAPDLPTVALPPLPKPPPLPPIPPLPKTPLR